MRRVAPLCQLATVSTMLRFGRLAVLLATACLASSTRAVTGRFEAATTWAENIDRASSPLDWRDAWRHEVRGAVSLARELRTGFLATGELDAGVEHVPTYRLLDAAHAGIGATLRQKFGLGAFAPHVALDLALRGRDTRLHAADGWAATGAVRAGKRLTSSLRASVQGDWEENFATSEIYDTRHHRFFATVTWDIFPWLQLSHGNGRLWGSFNANASPAVWQRALAGSLGSHISGYYNQVPWAALDVFGPGWVTYRVYGRVSFHWLELSPALGRNTSLPLRYESRVSINKVGVKYRQDIWTLSLLHRF